MWTRCSGGLGVFLNALGDARAPPAMSRGTQPAGATRAAQNASTGACAGAIEILLARAVGRERSWGGGEGRERPHLRNVEDV